MVCFYKSKGNHAFSIFLNGWYFAKSIYDYYDTIDFTKRTIEKEKES